MNNIEEINRRLKLLNKKVVNEQDKTWVMIYPRISTVEDKFNDVESASNIYKGKFDIINILFD